MPGMDGWEAARRLKADPQTADIPIIALTAWDEERAREAGLRWIPLETLPAEDHP